MELIIKKNEKQEITNSLALLFDEYNRKLDEIKKLSDSVNKFDGVVNYFIKASNITNYETGHIFDYDKAKDVLNAEMWSKAIHLTNVLDCMPAKDRNEWNENIRSYNTPDFNKETVIGTIQSLLLNRDNFLAQKVDGIFNKLSGEHVTNSPAGFNKKMIISGVISYYDSVDYEVVEYINDLRQIILKLLGQKEEDHKNKRTQDDIYNIKREGLFGEWFEFDGGAFRLKLFKKGTAHIEVNESVALKLNSILAMLHPMSIPPKHRQVNKKKKEFVVSQELLNDNVLNSIMDLIQKTKYKKPFFFNPSISKEDKNKLFEIIKNIGGMIVNNTVSFDYDASEVLTKIRMKGSVPDRKSHQFYPTEERLAKIVSSLVSNSKFDSVLEPSAGIGSLVDALDNKNKVTCIELSDVNAEILKSKGYFVENQDFLDYPISNKFDRIIMNPPFTNGQAMIHLEKGISHLEKDGKLVAILPSSMKNNKKLQKYKHRCSDIIEDAFRESGTGVSVVILEVWNK